MEDVILLVDTNVFIDHLRSKHKDTTLYWKLRSRHRLATTSITEMELLVGAVSPRHQAAVDNVLFNLPRLPFDSAAAVQAAETWLELRRRGRQTEIRDLMIAAIALAGCHSLVTLNQRHFEHFPGLVLFDLTPLTGKEEKVQ